jgi:methyltransferase (TIGR00027 family)
MARTDDDTWDLATSVGATATVVAAARALAGRQGDPLVNDPFAEPLVRAVKIAPFSRALDGHDYLPPEAQDRLFDAVTALSPPGSRIATEYHPDGGASIAGRASSMSAQPAIPHRPGGPNAAKLLLSHRNPKGFRMTSNSARREGDSWDLASGVGATATAVAASRALATRAGVIEDPWAEPLVRAVGSEHFLTILDGEPGGDSQVERMADGMAVRTQYFDAFLAEATAAGIRQVVILATGLDARAYRLQWPDGTVVYEIDQAGVLEFKVATLRALNAEPMTEVRNVAVDLRDDWPTALRASGFDTERPTAWIAEGLLMYLPAEAQDRLFDHITALSPPGSRIATEFMPSMDAFTADDGRWKKYGFNDDLAGLVYAGERSHVIEYLSELGWNVTGSLVQELFEAYGIEHHDDEMAAQFQGFQYVSARLG